MLFHSLEKPKELNTKKFYINTTAEGAALAPVGIVGISSELQLYPKLARKCQRKYEKVFTA